MASHIDHVASFILYGEQTFLYAERCGGVEPTCWKVVNSWPLPGSCPLLVTRLALGERDPLWVLGRDAPHALKLEQSCGKFPRLRFVSFECRLGKEHIEACLAQVKGVVDEVVRVEVRVNLQVGNFRKFPLPAHLNDGERFLWYRKQSSGEYWGPGLEKYTGRLHKSISWEETEPSFLKQSSWLMVVLIEAAKRRQSPALAT